MPLFSSQLSWASCGVQVTMRTLRNNQDTLMNVLETFVHDPLVEWNKAGQISSPVHAYALVSSMRQVTQVNGLWIESD